MKLSNSINSLDLNLGLGRGEGKEGGLYHLFLCPFFYNMGAKGEGLVYFLKGLRHNEEIGNKEAQAYALNGAGYIYGILGDNKKGLEFLHRALALSQEIKNTDDLQSSILDSLAVTYLNDGQMDKAYETYLECLKLSERTSQKIRKGICSFWNW